MRATDSTTGFACGLKIKQTAVAARQMAASMIRMARNCFTYLWFYSVPISRT